MNKTYDFAHLVCPCNTISDFPQPCPYHTDRTTEGDWFDVNYRFWKKINTSLSPTAWECTRCNRVNAPHVDQCSCSPPDWTLTYTTTTHTGGTIVTATLSPMMCDHANEVPASCMCTDDCYCRSHTCKPVDIYSK